MAIIRAIREELIRITSILGPIVSNARYSTIIEECTVLYRCTHIACIYIGSNPERTEVVRIFRERTS
jgi:hypothetical protein